MDISYIYQCALNFIQAQWLTLVSVLFGAGGFILFLINRKYKKPLYSKKSTNVINNYHNQQFDEINILYKGKQIQNFTSTQISIWNSGTEVIDIRDIAPGDELRIESKKGIKILDYKVIKNNNKANKIILNKTPIFNGKNKEKIKIDFDYLDPNKGFVIQLLHTGKSSDDITINGTIKGFGKIKEYYKYRLFRLLEESKELNPIFLTTRPDIFLKNMKYIMFITFLIMSGLTLVDSIVDIGLETNYYISVLFILVTIQIYFTLIRDKVPNDLK